MVVLSPLLCSFLDDALERLPVSAWTQGGLLSEIEHLAYGKSQLLC
jgi:hypothetical protein